MLRPKPLAAGGHVRIISPALPTIAHIPERARRADRVLRDLGFEVSYGVHAFSISDDGISAGSAADRAADFMEAFEDDSVDAILTSDAGMGSRDILPLLSAASIVAHPKPFIGFCDTAFLHQYLASCAGMSSFYGCVFMIHLAESGGPFPETLDFFERAVMASDALTCQPMPSRTRTALNWYDPELEPVPRKRGEPGGWTWLRPGLGRGQLVGGEISIIPEIVSYFDLRLEQSVLFWDIAGSNKLPLRPQFKKLCTSADLKNISGMIVAAHPRLPSEQWAVTIESLINEFLPGAAFPILVNADLGHLSPSWIVPYGEDMVMDHAEGIIFPRTSVLTN